MQPDDIKTYRILAGIDPCPKGAPRELMLAGLSSNGTGEGSLGLAWCHASFAMALAEGRPWAKKWFEDQGKL